MPELPEVETIRRDLSKKITGERIISVDVKDAMGVRFPEPHQFVSRLVGKTIKEVQRRGKAIVISLSEGDFFVIQLVMTGQLIYGKKPIGQRIILRLSNQCYLNYNDQRRFGRLSVVKNLNELKFFRSLGPEPLSGAFRADWLNAELKKRKVPIKVLLLNQNFIAGIGNIYASEILFRAGINPRKPANRLNEKEIQTLRRTTIRVLKSAVKSRGTSFYSYRDLQGKRGNYVRRLAVYDREDKAWVRCGGTIERIVQAGRSTFFCRRCQC